MNKENKRTNTMSKFGVILIPTLMIFLFSSEVKAQSSNLENPRLQLSQNITNIQKGTSSNIKLPDETYELFLGLVSVFVGLILSLLITAQSPNIQMINKLVGLLGELQNIISKKPFIK